MEFVEQKKNSIQPTGVIVPDQRSSSGGGSLWLKLGLIMGLLALGKVGSMARYGPVGSAQMRLISIIIGEIVILILAIVNVDSVFCILLLYVPFSQRFPGDYGTAVNIANILIVIVIFGLFLRSVKEGGHFFVRTEIDRWIGVYLLMIFLSFFRTSIGETMDWFLLITLVKRYCTPIFLYYLTSWVVRDRKGLSDCIFVVLLTTLMVAFLATKDTHTPTHFAWDRREAGVVDQANILAAFIVYYMFYYFSFFKVNSSQFKYWLLLLCLYPCVRTIMISFSRGGYVAFVVSTLFISFIANKALFLIVAIIMLAVWMNPGNYLPQAVSERITGTKVESRSAYSLKSSSELEYSAQSRLDIWRGGIKMILKNPFFGVGYGRFPAIIGQYGPGLAGKDAHNAYILIAAEMGIPALFLFIMITIKLFRYSLYLYKTYLNSDKLFAGLGLGYATGVIGLWTANIFGCRFNTMETISYFWILGALLMLVKKLEPKVVDANAIIRNGLAAPGNRTGAIRSSQR